MESLNKNIKKTRIDMFQELFSKIEKETNLFYWNVEDINIWSYERFTVQRYFIQK